MALVPKRKPRTYMRPSQTCSAHAKTWTDDAWLRVEKERPHFDPNLPHSFHRNYSTTDCLSRWSSCVIALTPTHAFWTRTPSRRPNNSGSAPPLIRTQLSANANSSSPRMCNCRQMRRAAVLERATVNNSILRLAFGARGITSFCVTCRRLRILESNP